MPIAIAPLRLMCAFSSRSTRPLRQRLLRADRRGAAGAAAAHDDDVDLGLVGADIRYQCHTRSKRRNSAGSSLVLTERSPGRSSSGWMPRIAASSCT